MASLRIGPLNKQVTVQQRAPGKDSHGQRLQTWTDHLANLWAAIEPVSGRELVAAQAVNAEVSHVVRLRHRAGITAGMRVLYQGRIFDIQAVLDPAMRHEQLRLLCLEGLSEG